MSVKTERVEGRWTILARIDQPKQEPKGKTPGIGCEGEMNIKHYSKGVFLLELWL